MNGAGMKYKGPKYHASRGRESAYDAILSFLSTIEPVTDCHTLGESEKPMQEGLEEEIQSFWNRASGFQPKFATLEVKENGFAVIARHFAQWGAEHLKK